MSEGDSSHPYFAVSQPRAFGEARLYRLYVTPEELVWVWTAYANEVGVAVSQQLGLLGFLLRRVDSSKNKRRRRLEELDSKPFDELREDNKHNFAIRVDEVESAEIAPASFWFRTAYSTMTQVGLLRVSVPTRKRLTLVIASNEDMQEAIDLLTPRLGWKLQVRLAWDEERMKYGPV